MSSIAARKRAKRRKNKNDIQSNNSKRKQEFSYTIDQLLDKVDDMLDDFQYDPALKFCQRALEIDSDNLRALETCGLVLLETSNVDEAKHCFGRAVELCPDSGHAKYMYLGQLFEGVESVQFFKKGIEVMKQRVEAMQNNTEAVSPSSQLSNQASSSKTSDSSTENSKLKRSLFKEPTIRDISSAYCSIAELYMTDLCDESEAESECYQAINAAIETDVSNAEAWQIKASFHLIKAQMEEAKAAIEKSIDLWWPKVKCLLDKGSEHDGHNNGVDADDFNVEELTGLSIDLRISACKILYELENYELAFSILEAIFEEEDEDNYQVSYLLTLCGKQLWPNGEDSSLRHYATLTKIMADKLSDTEMSKEMEELIESLPADDKDEDMERTEEIVSSDSETEDMTCT